MSVALVIGGAKCLFDDLEAVEEQEIGYDGVVAANAAGVVWPGHLNAWVTIHPRFMYSGPNWAVQRSKMGFPEAQYVFSHHLRDKIVPINIQETPWEMPGLTGFGSSGLFAVKVALIDLGYSSVLLCGVPMTATPHFDRKARWSSATKFRRNWLSVDPAFRTRIRSMSGWTREQFGGPNDAHSHKSHQ